MHLWEQLNDLGGTVGECGGEAQKIVQELVDAGADAEPRLGVGMPEALLEGAGEALSSWQAMCHET
jgi:hypothetical protein